MKERLLQYLACPNCRGEISVAEVTAREALEIIEGSLACEACARSFPIVHGVPRFASMADVGEEKADIAERFGWEWKNFTQRDDRYAEQLLGWLNPVRPEFFKDKVVLDAGCGKGRHTILAADWGAREVIGIDLSDAVDVAFPATRARENVHIVQADVCKLPFKRIFDYA